MEIAVATELSCPASNDDPASDVVPPVPELAKVLASEFFCPLSVVKALPQPKAAKATQQAAIIVCVQMNCEDKA